MRNREQHRRRQKQTERQARRFLHSGDQGAASPRFNIPFSGRNHGVLLGKVLRFIRSFP